MFLLDCKKWTLNFDAFFVPVLATGSQAGGEAGPSTVEKLHWSNIQPAGNPGAEEILLARLILLTSPFPF